MNAILFLLLAVIFIPVLFLILSIPVLVYRIIKINKQIRSIPRALRTSSGYLVFGSEGLNIFGMTNLVFRNFLFLSAFSSSRYSIMFKEMVNISNKDASQDFHLNHSIKLFRIHFRVYLITFTVLMLVILFIVIFGFLLAGFVKIFL